MISALDRAGDQLREERHKEEEVQRIRLGLDLAASHIDHIADRLECVERDTHWQDEVERNAAGAEANHVENSNDLHGEEIEILERRQDRQRHHNPKAQSGTLRATPAEQQPCDVSGRRATKDESQQPRIDDSVEVQASH